MNTNVVKRESVTATAGSDQGNRWQRTRAFRWKKAGRKRGKSFGIRPAGGRPMIAYPQSPCSQSPAAGAGRGLAGEGLIAPRWQRP